MPIQNGKYLSQFVVRNNDHNYLTCMGWHDINTATIYEEAELMTVNLPSDAVAVCWIDNAIDRNIEVESKICHG